MVAVAEEGPVAEVMRLVSQVEGEVDPEAVADMIDAASEVESRKLEAGVIEEAVREDIQRGVRVALMGMAAARSETVNSNFVFLSFDGNRILYVAADPDVFAAFESLIKTARANEVDANDLLRDVLARAQESHA